MEKIENPFLMAAAFHEVFDSEKASQPTAYTPQAAGYRAGFKVEELVEFLYAAAGNDSKQFDKLIENLHQDIEAAKEKIQDKKQPVRDPLVEQVDALIDLLYFSYGSFVLMGVDPTEIFSIVHAANMGKLFPDGKPHYHPVTNKVLKPEGWESEFAPEGKIKAEIDRQMKNL